MFKDISRHKKSRLKNKKLLDFFKFGKRKFYFLKYIKLFQSCFILNSSWESSLLQYKNFLKKVSFLEI